jgi:hypothetical protein
MMLIHQIVNRLSVVYEFPSDPNHPVSRKRMNDIRLNALLYLFKISVSNLEQLRPPACRPYDLIEMLWRCWWWTRESIIYLD